VVSIAEETRITEKTLNCHTSLAKTATNSLSCPSIELAIFEVIGDHLIAYNGLFLILIHILTIGVCVCVMVVESVEFRLDG
jgi:hypothetical protein